MKAGVGVALVLFTLAIAALAILPFRGHPTAREIRTELMAELQPVTLANCTLQRMGSANDGGYLMCANLLDAVRSAYSVRHRTLRRLGMRDLANLQRARAPVPIASARRMMPAPAAAARFTTSASARDAR